MEGPPGVLGPASPGVRRRPGHRASGRPDRYDPPMALGQLYRLRSPSSGEETLVEAQLDRIYLDEQSGERLEVVGKLIPLAPTPSRLPWAVENLRFCDWCDQPAQKDLNDCPWCARRMSPIGA